MGWNGDSRRRFRIGGLSGHRLFPFADVRHGRFHPRVRMTQPSRGDTMTALMGTHQIRRVHPSRMIVPAMAAALLQTGSARAHNFTITDVLCVLKTNSTYQMDMTVDVDALALGLPSNVQSDEAAVQLQKMSPDELQRCLEYARQTIEDRVRIRFDGAKVTPLIEFPDHGRPMVGLAATAPTVLGITARLTGEIPPGAKEFSIGLSRAFNVSQVTIVEQSTAGAVRYLLGPSEDSPPYRLGEPPNAESNASAPGINVALRYLALGFEHILPLGLDHILFVVGLFLLSPRLKPLLWQVTAFTVAHSVTLALSMYDVVSLPARIVEPLIALSIAYVAMENVMTGELKPWRPFVVFAFGLLHGLGFAGVLRELGLPRDQFVTALITFNVGVELGQLTVVLICFALVGWFQRRAWYRSAIVVPASVFIALVGLYWSVDRVIGGA